MTGKICVYRYCVDYTIVDRIIECANVRGNEKPLPWDDLNEQCYDCFGIRIKFASGICLWVVSSMLIVDSLVGCYCKLPDSNTPLRIINFAFVEQGQNVCKWDDHTTTESYSTSGIRIKLVDGRCFWHVATYPITAGRKV